MVLTECPQNETPSDDNDMLLTFFQNLQIQGFLERMSHARADEWFHNRQHAVFKVLHVGTYFEQRKQTHFIFNLPNVLI